MNDFKDYTDVEKERLKLKIKWEGGLLGYCDYGIAKRLYLKFENEFDKAYIKKYDKWNKTKIKHLEPQVMNYLNDRKYQKTYTDSELNDVNYIFDE